MGLSISQRPLTMERVVKQLLIREMTYCLILQLDEHYCGVGAICLPAGYLYYKAVLFDKFDKHKITPYMYEREQKKEEGIALPCGESQFQPHPEGGRVSR